MIVEHQSLGASCCLPVWLQLVTGEQCHAVPCCGRPSSMLGIRVGLRLSCPRKVVYLAALMLTSPLTTLQELTLNHPNIVNAKKNMELVYGSNTFLGAHMTPAPTNGCKE